MYLKIKLLGGILPKWKPLDAGLDLHANEDVIIKPTKRALIKLGIATEFQSNFVGLIQDRSGLALNNGVTVIGGVIDSSYRGEWGVILLNVSVDDFVVDRGDRIAQVLFIPIIHLAIKEVKLLSDSVRGEHGFGSTGK